MARLSNCLFLSFNILALTSGCFAIGSYLYFQAKEITDCKNVVQKPLLVMGIILILISLLGLIGTFCKFTFLLWFYSFVALLFLIGLTGFSVFIYMIDNPNASDKFSGLGFKKHNIQEHYTQWLQNMVAYGKHWDGIRSCLIEHQVCKRLHKNNIIQNTRDYFDKQLSPIESGCCKPPIYCGFEFKNATFWTVPKLGLVVKDGDCSSWNNDKDKLCYNCDSCKFGVMEKSRKIWKIFAILDFIDIGVLLIMYFLSCCTRNNIVSDRKYKRVHP